MNLDIEWKNHMIISIKKSTLDFCKTSRRRFQDVLKTSRQEVLKMSWRRLEDVLKTFLQDILKTSWKRLEDVFKTSWICLENVLKTSWRRMTKANILVLTKTSSEDVCLRRIYSSWSRRLQDVFWRQRHWDYNGLSCDLRFS